MSFRRITGRYTKKKRTSIPNVFHISSIWHCTSLPIISFDGAAWDGGLMGMCLPMMLLRSTLPLQ